MENLMLRTCIAVEQGYVALRRHLKRGQSGQTTVELALIIAFVAIMAIIGLKALQVAINDVFGHVTTCLNSASTPVTGTPVPGGTAGSSCP